MPAISSAVALPAALIDPLSAPFMQRALVETTLLAVLAGVLGTWIVLRGLAFYSHAVGTATYPGLVVADGLGLPAQALALVCAVLMAALLRLLGHRPRTDVDGATALVLVGALALGTVLASDVFRSGSGVDTLLFGTLIGLHDRDLWMTAGVAVAAVLGDLALHRSWAASAFDAPAARSLGVRPELAERALLVLVALAVVVCLSAVGALLVSAVLVLPAATVRLLAPSMLVLRAGAGLLALAEGVGALMAAWYADVAPGPTLAVIGGVVFGLVALGRAVIATTGRPARLGAVETVA